MEKDEYEFNNFTYKTSINGSEYSIEHNKNEPERICKFYSFEYYHVEALIDSYLYASHPYELNDIFDGSNYLLGKTKNLSVEKYKWLYEEKYEENMNKDKNGQYYNYTFWNVISYKFGLISFTTEKNKNNALMWPHYTKETGFQIEFKTELLKKGIKDANPHDFECVGFFPVNYTKELRPIDPSEFKPYIPFIYITNIKQEVWSYENEWRFVVSRSKMGIPNSKKGLKPTEDLIEKNARKIYYNADNIEAIVLGANFFSKSEGFNVIVEKHNNISVESYKISLNEDILNKKNKTQTTKDFLRHIAKNLNDRLYMTAINTDKFGNLIRGRQEITITEIDSCGFFVLKLLKKMEFDGSN